MAQQNNNQIRVVPYNPEWVKWFEREASQIKQALGENCIKVLHVGSTSIPNLAAKPIIDMIPVVRDILNVDTKIEGMKTLGYTALGENGMPFRRYFQKEVNGVRIANVHIFEENSPEIKRNVVFRDYLRNHAEERDIYGALKEQLAKAHPNDILAYIEGKDKFVKDIIENKAGFDDYRLVKTLMKEEWDAYHRIRRVNLFEPIGFEYDPNHWTIKDPNFHHFIFSKGKNYIGACMIELCADNHAILRTIAIDKPYQNQGNGAVLLKWMERWMQHQGKTFVSLHSTLKSVSFYKRHGYVDIPRFEELEPDIKKNSVDLGKKF